jgi:hypothetical protein
MPESPFHLVDSPGRETGVDRRAAAACSRRMAEFFGRDLAGKLYRLDEAKEDGCPAAELGPSDPGNPD